MFLSSLYKYKYRLSNLQTWGWRADVKKRIGIRILTSPASLGFPDKSCLSIHSEDSAQASKLLPVVCTSKSPTLSSIKCVAVFSLRYLDTNVVLIPTHEFCAPNPILFKTPAHSATEELCCICDRLLSGLAN